MKTETNYDQQAADFLSAHGLKFRATLSDSKPAPWDEADAAEYRPHYRITLSKPGHRLTFDFWASVNAGRTGGPLSAYSVLSCVGGDATCPAAFADFCAEYGENEDSRKARQTFRRADRFARRLRAFFAADEIAALAEIW